MALLHFKTYKVTVINKSIYKGTNQQIEIENTADNQEYMNYYKNHSQVKLIACIKSGYFKLEMKIRNKKLKQHIQAQNIKYKQDIKK